MSKKNGKEKIDLERLQSYGEYDTDSYQVLDGTASGVLSTALDADQLYRVKAFSADCWVKIGAAPSAVTEEGMLMTTYDEISLVASDGDKIAVIGGKLNIVPLS